MSEQKTKIVLDDNKIKKSLKIEDVIEIVEEGFRKKGKGFVNLPPKTGPKLSDGAFADSMSVSVFAGEVSRPRLRTFGIKWLTSFPDKLKKGLPVLTSLIILNNPKTGLPLAILSGNWITAIRTAAVSAVTAKYLAPKKKELTIGVFGLGLQAYVHIVAFKSAFKNAKFILYNHGDKYVKEFMKKFPRRRGLETSPTISRNHHEVVRDSDIVISVTSFPPKISPYIFAKDFKKDVLILPVDYGSRVDPGLYKYLDEIYTDDISQYEKKSKLRQYFPPTTPKIKKEVGELIAKGYRRGNSAKRILVFNLGIALFDILTAKLFIEKTK